MVQNTKVFVGSLPVGSKPEELRRLFENFGVVTECDIMNKCGFVHMQTPEMAQDAIQALNNTQFNGQTIVVEPGRMKDRNAGGRGGFNRGNRGGGRGGGNRDQRGGGGGGPMRNSRTGPMNRQSPYGGPKRDFGNRGGNRFGDNNGGIQDFEPMRPPPSFPGFDGFSNEDRRGFALPNQYDNNVDQNRGTGGGFQRSSAPMNRQGGGRPGFGGRSNDGNNRGGFNKGGFGGQVGQRGSFNRGGQGGGMNRGGMTGFGVNKGPQGDQSGSGYNQQFPPLGGGGHSNRGNQGPPRMQNRRF